jgi:ketosteroid isomerase-like protein
VTLGRGQSRHQHLARRHGDVSHWRALFARPIRCGARSNSIASVVVMDTHTLAVAYVERLEARDWDGVTALLAEAVVYEMPQTRERITGRQKFMRFNVEYPSDWHLAIRRVVAEGAHAAIWLDVRDDGRPVDAIVWLDTDDGQITRVTDYWPERSDPMPGREHLTTRF